MSKKSGKKVQGTINTKAVVEKPIQAESSALKVICVGRFLDIKENVIREVGAEWEVDKDRAEYLQQLGLVKVL